MRIRSIKPRTQLTNTQLGAFVITVKRIERKKYPRRTFEYYGRECEKGLGREERGLVQVGKHTTHRRHYVMLWKGESTIPLQSTPPGQVSFTLALTFANEEAIILRET